MFDWILDFDLGILNYIYNNMRTPFLNGFMPIVTNLCEAGILWIAIAFVMLFFKKTRKTGIMMGAALIIGLILCNCIMKPAIDRIRPYDLMEQKGIIIDILLSKKLTDGSFPSGHTLACFEATTVLLYSFRKWGYAALALSILISFSRLYLFVHYPSDVIAGMLFGILFGILGIMIVNFVYRKFIDKNKNTLTH